MYRYARLAIVPLFIGITACQAQSDTPAPVTPPVAAPEAAAPAAAPAAPAASAPAAAAPAAGDYVMGLPPGPNRDLTIQVCGSCHDTSNFAGQRHTKDDWAGVVASMGTGQSAEDDAKIVDYLATALGPQ